MSLTAPTRPLPSSPLAGNTDLPSRSSSTAGPSRKNEKQKSNSSPSRSILQRGSENEVDLSRRDSERARAAQSLSASSTTDGSIQSHPGAPGLQVQVNDLPEETASWGANFWVTIQDPMTQSIFYACPSTGQTSWDPPLETFLMPLNDDGHWWELADDSRGGTPYYYHTKTGETQWIRPDGFVIPLGIIQTTTTLGRRLSQNTWGRSSQSRSSVASANSDRRISLNRRSRSYGEPSADRIDEEDDAHHGLQRRPSIEQGSGSPSTGSAEGEGQGAEGRTSPSPRRANTGSLHRNGSAAPTVVTTAGGHQSLGGVAAEIIADASRDDKKRSRGKGKEKKRDDSLDSFAQSNTPPISPSKTGRIHFPPETQVQRALKDAANVPPSPRRTLPSVPPTSPEKTRKNRRDQDLPPEPNVNGKDIGSPHPDPDATFRLSPLKTKAGKAILVDFDELKIPSARLSTGDHKILPRPLAADIQQFAVADFAKRYFSTHKTGLIFRRRVPVEQMMSWQKAPLQAPLLILNRSLHKDAVKAFKVIQKIMGDRDREKPVGIRGPSDGGNPAAGSTASLNTGAVAKEIYGIGSVLEEERWMLSEGLTHGELRDEIFCQVVKQLSNNPSPESTFHGWQLLCVMLVTFPPSKNFEAYLRTFMQERLTHTEGRIDIMAKYCLSRLAAISKKGPRGKPPTIQEIESAADAAFNPSTFGESLDSIMRLQQRTYPESKVPIVLPFLADSIIALGGAKREGIFRVPGDAETVSEMKVRIDKGHYNLQGVDDPHVPASLLKMWLRELQEPIIPMEVYNDCVAAAEEPEEIIKLVKKLPTLNRRVLLFVVSFLQMFVAESVSSVTKMASQSLALVMAPNLLRCNSDSLAVIFTNSRFEHIFVHNLLVHLKCHKIDPDYVPAHGMGAGSASGTSVGRPKSSHRRTGT